MKNILLLVISLFLFSCTGYEDGPKISFRKVKKKLCDKMWSIETVKKNNIDVTQDIKVRFNYRLEFVGYFEYRPYGPATVFVRDCCNEGYSGSGSWQFENHGSETNYDSDWIYIRLLEFKGDTLPIYPFIKDKFIKYQITGLSTDNLFLVHKDSVGNLYKLEMVNK